MCKIIAIANQKGGVAKTTTTINLGVGLSKVGKRVMLIDADPQGHLTMGLGFPKNLRVTLKTMMENIIMGLEFDPREAILHAETYAFLRQRKNKKKRFHSGYLCTYKERLQYLYGLASGHKPVCK